LWFKFLDIKEENLKKDDGIYGDPSDLIVHMLVNPHHLANFHLTISQFMQILIIY